MNNVQITSLLTIFLILIWLLLSFIWCIKIYFQEKKEEERKLYWKNL